MSVGDRFLPFALRLVRPDGASRAALPIGTSLALLALTSCGGGGGGSSGSGFDSHGKLLSVTFPDPSDVNTEAIDTPPALAPLLQQVVLTFDSNPDPNTVGSGSIQIRDGSGFPVAGQFVVDGPVVTFTPQLPTRPVSFAGDGSVNDDGGAGLDPGGAYTVRLGSQTFKFISSIDSKLLARFRDPNFSGGILIGFRTGIDPAHFFAGLPLVAPIFLESDPVDGVTGVSPDLYTDPDHLFPPRRSFLLRFDAPVNPDVSNVSGDTFQLIDLDDRPGGFPNGLPLGINVSVLENALDHSVVEIMPSGVLPFGHQLALEYPVDLQGTSQTGTLNGTKAIAATFTTATTSAGLVNDTLVEDFDANDREERDVAETGNVLPANWNVRGSGILQANFAFQGDGLLGRFIPPPPAAGDTKVVVLDTTTQPFPLFDGSTPDAPVFTVVGGVFPFTDIDIPAGVVIQPVGNNPIVITATGSVRIAGTIFVGGQDGTGDYAYDSAVTSVPGGAAVAGGGRGGEGHPILFYPPDQVSYGNLVSPPYGGQGFGIDPADGVMKRIGGGGGQSGMIDNPDSKGNYSTNHELDCSEFRGGTPNVKVPGGGGGSMYLQGHQPGDADGGYAGKLKNGRGNVLPNGQGGYVIRDIEDKVLPPGAIGQWAFYNDGTGQNDFYGSRGQLTRLIGGQGGGAGASMVDGYYCGIWCDHDEDSTNNAVCNGEDFGTSGKFGDSVGDSRGGGGGGGGGAILIQALGGVVLTSSARIDAHGGVGRGGEAIECSNWGGGGAGGAGGMVVIQSSTDIRLDGGCIVDVREGLGKRAAIGDAYGSCNDAGSTGAPGDGGPGGQGFVQLQVPAGQTALVIDTTTAFPRRSTKYDPIPWIDQTNTQNPVEFTPISVAVSTWFDLGRMIARQPGTSPTFTFGGLDANGIVITDVDGNVADPAGTDIECDYLGEYDEVHHAYKSGKEPKADFIPPNATVKVEFQGANAIVEGSKEIDPASVTLWGTSAAAADGLQFIRWRITFDLTANTGDPLSPDTPRPSVQRISVHSQY